MSPLTAFNSAMIPPSRCWISLRSPATLTTPGATAALSSGANAAQPPATPKNKNRMAKPVRVTPVRRRGAGSKREGDGTGSGTTFNAGTRLMLP